MKHSRTYAISFDLDDTMHEHEDRAHNAIMHALADHGLAKQKSGLYFSDSANPVACVLAVQDMARKHPWLRFRNIRMLRIEEDSDLMPALT